MPNREGEDEDDDPPEGKQSKSKRRLVCIVCIVYNSFFSCRKASNFTLHHSYALKPQTNFYALSKVQI